MKLTICFSILLASVIVIQSCGPREKKAVNSESEGSSISPTKLTLEEKRALNEKNRIAQLEKRNLDLQSRIKNTPFYTDEQNNVVYNKAEIDPAFAGGEKAMDKYLRENIKYPAQAQKDELEGTIFVDFIIGANGNVRSIAVSDMPREEIDESLRAEAIRVISNMPKWTPGRQRGKAVDVKFSQPITFRIL